MQRAILRILLWIITDIGYLYGLCILIFTWNDGSPKSWTKNHSEIKTYIHDGLVKEFNQILEELNLERIE